MNEYKTFKTKTQNFKVLEYLKSGASLSCLDAIKLGLTHNLRSRIADLKRAGYDIEVKQVSHNGGYHAEYRLEVSNGN